MSQSRKYSFEEVLNFTVEDIQGPNFVDVKVKSWRKLTSDQREQCIVKLRTRDLVRQRDEMAQSRGVDANELETRLRHVGSCPSQTPTPPPPDPDDPKELERDLKIELESYETLVGDHGRPCYPIELGFEVLDDPGQYEDIISYWRGEPGMTDTSRLLYRVQWKRWRKFRRFQQRIRRYFISRNRFPEYQQRVLERRRRHGLDGDAQLHEDRERQSKLDDWMEYQDCEYQRYEYLEKDLEKAGTQLASGRKALAEAGVPGFGAVSETDNFGTYYGLAVEHGKEEAKARRKTRSATQKLKLAEKRLKTAQSEDLGERVERATWITLFMEDAQSAHIGLDKIPKAEDKKEDWLPGGKYHRREGESEEEWWEAEFKRREASKKLFEAEVQASLEVEFADEGLKMAQADEFGEAVERDALIRMVQKEVQTARIQFDESKESTEKIELRGEVLGALGWISSAKMKLDRHKTLLEWIEQQRREMIRGCVDAEKEDNQSQSKETRRKALRNYPATEASRRNRSSKANGRTPKQSTARSILRPIDPSKVSKAHSPRRRKMSVSGHASQTVERATTDPRIPESRSKQASAVKDIVPKSLRPIHSSRVSKSGDKRSTGLRKDGTKPPTTDERRKNREQILGVSSGPSTRQKAMQQSSHTNASLRRSTRISRKPDRFSPAGIQ